jgi:hypothetical protein
MADRHALVVAPPGSISAYEEAFGVLRESSGPRGKVMLEVSAP